MPHHRVHLDSPLLSNRRDKTKASIDTVILIPAVEIKTHYQSIVGQPFVPAQPSPSSSTVHTCYQEDTTLFQHGNEEYKDDEKPDRLSPHCDLHVYDISGNPVKKGVLIVSAVIAPLPHDLELNPSLLDFIEQVVRPINISTQESEFAESDEEDDIADELGKEAPAIKSQSSLRPLSFPVDVSITFTVHPSKIYLTCSPHAHVKCLIEIPTVNFVISFSLFVRKQVEHLHICQTRLQSSTPLSLGEEEIVTFNNLHVTGCFKTFALVMYTPPLPGASSSKLGDLSKKDKEAFNLVLGQAYVHMSRKSVYVPLSSVEKDLNSREKLRVSGINFVHLYDADINLFL